MSRPSTPWSSGRSTYFNTPVGAIRMTVSVLVSLWVAWIFFNGLDVHWIWAALLAEFVNPADGAEPEEQRNDDDHRERR